MAVSAQLSTEYGQCVEPLDPSASSGSTHTTEKNTYVIYTGSQSIQYVSRIEALLRLLAYTRNGKRRL